VPKIEEVSKNIELWITVYRIGISGSICAIFAGLKGINKKSCEVKNQYERAKILFEIYPDIEKAYKLQNLNNQ